MIKMVEAPDSRELHYGPQGGGQTFKLNVVTTAGETEAQVYLYALQSSQPYYGGLIRNDLKVVPNGGPNVFRVEIEYGPTGVGGGDQPLGGVGNDGGPPQQPTGPATPQTPLTGGWSFSIQAPTLHITQSLETVGAYGLNGAAPPDFKGAIGISKDGPDQEVEGCDIPPPARTTIKRTVAAPVVTQAYVDLLATLAGRPNANAFWHWGIMEVLFQSAEGQYTQGEGWSINFTFGIEKTDPNVIICDGLPQIPQQIFKYGWDYLWVLYDKKEVAGKVLKRPVAAYVERVLLPADFSLLGIGT